MTSIAGVPKNMHSLSLPELLNVAKMLLSTIPQEEWERDPDMLFLSKIIRAFDRKEFFVAETVKYINFNAPRWQIDLHFGRYLMTLNEIDDLAQKLPNRPERASGLRAPAFLDFLMSSTEEEAEKLRKLFNKFGWLDSHPEMKEGRFYGESIDFADQGVPTL